MRRHIWSVLVFVPLMLSASSRAEEPKASEKEPVYQGKTLTEWIGDLKDPKAEIQRAAATSLVVFGPKKQSVSALAAALKESTDAGCIIEAARTLGKFGPAAKPALHALTLALKRAAPKKSSTVQQMEVSDKPAGSADAKIQRITFTLVTGDSAMLRACADALGRIRPEAKGTVAAMRLALGDLDEGVRWAALCALLECGLDTKEAVPILRNILRDKDAALRRVAVQALGKSRGEAKSILPLLTTALKDEDAAVREAAVKTLGEMGAEAKPAAPALLGALKDTATNVRREAAEALGKIGAADEAVIAALIAALKDKEEDVVGAAGMALGQFGPRAKAAIPSVLALVHDADAKKSAGACILLGFFGPAAKEAIPILEKKAREDSEEWVRLAAYTGLAKIDSSRVKDTVRRLTTALKSKTEEVRGAAIECLGFLGPDARDALPALRALREGSNDFSLNISLDRAMKEIEKPKP